MTETTTLDEDGQTPALQRCPQSPSDPVSQDPDPEDPAEDAERARGPGSAGGAGHFALVCAVVAVLGLLLAAPVLSHVVPGGAYVVASDSMEPAIPTGSLVVAAPGEPEVGDVVVYEAATGRLEVHRVVDVDRSGPHPTYTTQGDNNAASDSYVVEADQIQGVARFHLPYAAGFWLFPLWMRILLLGAGGGLYLWGELSEEPTASHEEDPERPPEEREDPDVPLGAR